MIKNIFVYKLWIDACHRVPLTSSHMSHCVPVNPEITNIAHWFVLEFLTIESYPLCESRVPTNSQKVSTRVTTGRVLRRVSVALARSRELYNYQYERRRSYTSLFSLIRANKCKRELSLHTMKNANPAVAVVQ